MPDAEAGWCVERLAADHRSAVELIAEQSGATVDVAAELGRTFGHSWVALGPGLERQVVGFLIGWSAADELHLIDVAVHPAFRRRGVASRLLTALLEHGRASQARLVLLEVRRSNVAAQALYTGFGFETVRVRRGYYDGGSEDGLELMLELERASSHTPRP